MAASASSPHLVVPIMLWGETAPSHCISAIQISHDHRTLVTGSHDGQLCVWMMDPETFKVRARNTTAFSLYWKYCKNHLFKPQATPKCLLLGHTSSIKCLVTATNTLHMECVVSSSENGYFLSYFSKIIGKWKS